MITRLPLTASTVVSGAGVIVAGLLAARTEIVSENGPLPHLFAALTLKRKTAPGSIASEIVYDV